MAERETFQHKPLPTELGEEVIAKAREFISWLKASGSTTHQDVRQMCNEVELSLGNLVGQVEAQKIRESGVPHQDEIDVWLENGLGNK